MAKAEAIGEVSYAGPTTGTAVASAAARLADAGCEAPRLDAELLVGKVLAIDRAGVVASPDRPLGRAQARELEALVARRVAREPTAYIVGRKPFRVIELEVDRRVLIPRPETELLVEVALELAPRSRVVDVGTGSGAVALALKHERPDLDVTGCDVSADALAVARANSARLNLDVRFVHSDLLAGVEGTFEAVLANLPYVADDELPELVPEIARYEPRSALLAGPDGLGLLRRLIREAAGVSFVALEVGAGQAGAVAALLRAQEAASVRKLRDLAGVERVVVARR